MIAGTLEIQMNANLARLAADMNNAKSMVGNAMSNVERMVGVARGALAALGIGLGVGYFVSLIKGSIDATARMKDLGQEAGISAAAISRFEEPARMAGLGLDSVATAMFRLNKAALESKDPASNAAQAFKSIGIATAQLKGLKPDEMFELIARSISKYSGGLEKNAVMQELLGKSGREMNRVMAEIAEKGKLVATVSDEQTEAADKLQDQMVELKMVQEKVGRQLASDFTPAMTQITKDFSDAYKEGGLFYGVLIGIGSALNQIKGTGAVAELARVDDEIALAKKAADSLRISGTTFLGMERTGEIEQAKTLIPLLEKKAAIEKAIFAEEIAAQNKRALVGLGQGAGAPKYDPAAAAASAAAAAKADAATKKYADELKALYNLLDNTGESVNAKFLEQYAMLNNEFAKGAMTVDLFVARMQALWGTTEMGKAQLKALLDAAKEQNAEFDQSYAKQLALEKVSEDASKNLADHAANLIFELSIMGLSNAERERAIQLRMLEKAGIDATTESAQRYLDSIAASANAMENFANSGADAWRQAGEDIANSLTKAFGAGGAAAGGMVTAYANGIARQIELDKKYQSQRKIAGVDLAALDKKHQSDNAKNSLSTYGNMAGAAAGFFDKSSKGYKALTAVSQIFHAAELALTLAELVPKAISAVLTQGQGDPYTAFARIAAMVAIVGALGVAVGGGGSASANISAERQVSIGTGSVLGDASAKSESIANAIELLNRTSILGNEHTADMRRSLMSIDASIGGLASIVVRTSGLLGGAGDLGGLSLGVQSRGFLGLGRSTNTLTDQGISVASQTGAQARAGFQASQYSDVTTSGRRWWGGSYSNTNRVQGALSPEIARQFTLVVGGIFETILSAARIFGSDSNYITQVLDAFQIDFSSISLKGLKGKEIEDALRAYFGKLGDDMAGSAFAGLADFQKIGEGLLETLVRLSQEFAATNVLASILGKDVATAFGAVGFASMAARTHLVSLFGGIEKLSEAVQYFYENFYSEEERIARTTSTVVGQFAALGVAMPASNAAFRLLVESLDLSTLAGRTMFASLMTVAPAFYSIGDAATRAAQAAAQATQSFLNSMASIYGAAFTAQQRETQILSLISQLSALSPMIAGLGSPSAILAGLANIGPDVWQSFRDQNVGNSPIISLIDQIAALYATIRSGNNSSGVPGVTTAIGGLGNAAADLAKRLADARFSLIGYMNGLLLNTSLSPLTPHDRLAESRRQYESVLGLARGGDVDAIRNLSSSSDAYLRIAREIFASSPAYNEIFGRVFGELGGVAGPGAPSFEAAFSRALPTNSHLASQADVGELKQAVYDLTMLIANGVKVTDPQITAQTTAITAALKNAGNKGVLVS